MSTPAMTSSTLDVHLTQWVNNLLSVLETSPGSGVPVSLSNVIGSLTLQASDCTAWQLQLIAPGTDGAPANALFTFPGAGLRVVGYINPTLMSVLMTPNTAQVVNASQLSGANVALPLPTFTKQKSGQVLVNASISGSVNPQTTVTVSLYRDGTTLLAQQLVTPGGAGGASDFAAALHFLDTLPDSGPHSYAVQALVSSATVTTPAGGAVVTAVEL